MSDIHSDLAHLRGLVPCLRPHPSGDGPAPPTPTATLAGLEQWLRTEQIPLMLVGSLVCAAWTGQDGLARFSRSRAFGKTQRSLGIVPIHAPNARRP
jgi:hypothetical protein